MLGANLALALISVQIFLVPLSLVSLGLGLGWSLHRVRQELVVGGVSLSAVAPGSLGTERRQGQ